MAVNWLVPIIQYDPLTFGASRIPLNGPFVADFLNKLTALHPRCLMSFKSHLLLSDESEEACGGSDQVIDWNGNQDITINGELELSHCAEAFMNCMPSVTEILINLDSLTTSEWNEIQLNWLEQMKHWLNSGFSVIIVKEA